MTEMDPPFLLNQKKLVHDPKMIGLWKVGRTIGKGSSGRVRIARHSKTGQYAAIKIVTKSSLASRVSLNRLADEVEHTQLAVEREIVVMKLINHPNIMRLYDVWETSTDLYLVLEYVQGGELFDYLCKKGRLPASEALQYFQQIISAVDYCHRFNIAHRDLKPENILLDMEFNVKIADFGMAAWQVNTQGGMLRTSCGSPHYAAPEIISGNLYNGSAADIWSCGIILYALLCGKLPFDDEDCPSLLEKVLRGKYIMPTDIDPVAQDLIARMLTTDVAKRISMPEILCHDFFTSQEPKIFDYGAPNLASIAHPIGDIASIDPDIFSNLRTLWHGTSDADIIASLMNDEQNWQKGIYHLLVNHRANCPENYEEEAITKDRLRRRRNRKAQMQLKSHPSPSISSIPLREGHPTSRRASRSTDAMSQVPDHGRQHHPGIPMISLSLPSPSPGYEAILPFDLPPLTVPDVQDDEMQAFFYQIVDHLHVLQVKTGTPDLNVWSTPPVGMAGTQGYLETLHGAPGEYGQEFGCEDWSLIAGIDATPRPTKPLTVKRKNRTHSVMESSDKENAMYADTRASKACRRLSLRTNKEKRFSPGERRIHIIEPLFERKQTKIQTTPKSVCSVSPALFDRESLPTGTSPTTIVALTNSPKCRWIDNVFRLRPTTYALLSRHSGYATIIECQKILSAMSNCVSLEGVEGTGMLKCQYEGTNDSGTSTVRSARFRAEVQKATPRQSQHGYVASLLLIQEKGSADVFKNVCLRLRQKWTLDNFDGNTAKPLTISPSPTISGRYKNYVL